MTIIIVIAIVMITIYITWTSFLALVSELGGHPLLFPTITKRPLISSLRRVHLLHFFRKRSLGKKLGTAPLRHRHKATKQTMSISSHVSTVSSSIVESQLGTFVHFSFWLFTPSCIALKLRHSEPGFVSPEIIIGGAIKLLSNKVVFNQQQSERVKYVSIQRPTSVGHFKTPTLYT